MKQDKVTFFEIPHSYWYDGRKIPSVGSVLNKYFPGFEQDYWLNHGVFKEEFGDEYLEHYRSFDSITPPADKLFNKFMDKMGSDFLNKKKALAESWELKSEIAKFRGKKFHSRFESESFSNGYMVNPWDGLGYAVSYYEKEFDNESITLKLFDLPDGAYPELLIFDLDLWIAGQADEVYIQTIGNTRYIDINDHKTNEKKPGKSDMNRCFPPFTDKYASTDFKYTMQINAYAYMLAKAGYVPRNLAYSWYKEYDFKQVQRIDVENIQSDMAKIMK